MPKFAPDDVLDAALDEIATADTLYICTDQPANFAGIAALALASIAVDAGDFTKANGDTSGRKLTVAGQSGIPITSSGDADHAVLANAAQSRLLYVTVTDAPQQLTAGGTLTTGSWDIEIADPQ